MSSARLPAPACSQAPLGAACCCCKFCEMGGCDVRVVSCGCCLHARCCPVSTNNLLTLCPICHEPATALQLMPMAFEEIDQARKQASLTAVSEKRGKKRKNATIARLTSSDVIGSLLSHHGISTITTATGNSGSAANLDACGEINDLRTGRWTQEETEYCDALIAFFEQGKLPIPEGTKLNDFLSNMLKSKQSRLTKKMKNARLSTRQYKRTTGYIEAKEAAQSFSRLETEFFASIKCPMERSEIRFHMQKEWREHFSSHCVAIGQSLDANAWLSSVEELDRRASQQKDAARMARRKVMMGQALSFDASNSLQRGVYIDASAAAATAAAAAADKKPPAKVPATISDVSLTSKASQSASGSTPHRQLFQELAKHDRNPMKDYASPFLAKVMPFIKRHSIPFEHVDVWVPSFVADGAATEEGKDQKCRLCFAGCATAETKVPAEGGSAVPLTAEEQFDLLAFGEYSQKFSFDIGCGLPGRVYNSGVASWEQGIQNAPLAQFERCGGASQWGIQTVLGVPIPSPNVGRIVVLFYSKLDRSRNLKLVNRIAEELTKLTPSPKWKLVVDVGVETPTKTADATEEEECVHLELLQLMQRYTPEDKTSPHAMFLPGFTSLRLLLMQQDRSDRDEELLKSVMACYDSYKKTGRPDTEIAAMTARDFMLLSKTSSSQASISVNSRTYSAGLPAATQLSQQQQQHQEHDGGGISNNTALLGIAPLPPQQQQDLRQQLQFQSLAKPVFGVPTPNSNSMDSASSNSAQYTLQSSMPSLAPQMNGGELANQLQQLLGSAMPSTQEQLNSLGSSPALQPITSHPDGPNNMLAPFGLTASQLQALLQNDAAMNFQGF